MYHSYDAEEDMQPAPALLSVSATSGSDEQPSLYSRSDHNADGRGFTSARLKRKAEEGSDFESVHLSIDEQMKLHTGDTPARGAGKNTNGIANSAAHVTTAVSPELPENPLTADGKGSNPGRMMRLRRASTFAVPYISDTSWLRYVHSRDIDQPERPPETTDMREVNAGLLGSDDHALVRRASHHHLEGGGGGRARRSLSDPPCSPFGRYVDEGGGGASEETTIDPQTMMKGTRLPNKHRSTPVHPGMLFMQLHGAARRSAGDTCADEEEGSEDNDDTEAIEVEENGPADIPEALDGDTGLNGNLAQSVANAAANGVLLEDSDALQRALHVLDLIPTMNTFKIGVVYVGPGQYRERDILANTGGSERYMKFLRSLGKCFFVFYKRILVTASVVQEPFFASKTPAFTRVVWIAAWTSMERMLCFGAMSLALWFTTSRHLCRAARMPPERQVGTEVRDVRTALATPYLESRKRRCDHQLSVQETTYWQ